MTPTLDEVFGTTPTAPPPVHPTIREWEKLVADSVETHVALSQIENGFGPASSELVVRVRRGDGRVTEDARGWDDDLNTWLIDRGFRSTDTANEKLRFAIGLRAPMRAATRVVGDGFFNAVLLELVTAAELTKHPEISEVLKYTHVPTTSSSLLGRKGYLATRQWIVDILSRKLFDLEDHLKYSHAEATDILAGALARFIDERFSVSLRRSL